MAKRKQPKQNEIVAAAPQRPGETTIASPDRERIAMRAYELYCQRGRTDGRADDDWLRAERELTDGGR